MTSTLTPAADRPTPPRRWRRTRSTALVAGVGGEIRKGIITFAAGWRGVLIQLVLFPSVYLLLVLFMGRGQFRADLLILTLPGAAAVIFLHEQVNRSFWGYLGDIQSGVLERTYLTPLPPWTLILGRQATAIIAALPHTAAIYLLGLIVINVQGASMPVDPQALVPLAAIAVATAGLALVVSGLTLVFKRIEILVETVMGATLILGGAFVPLHTLPHWVAILGRLLVPIAPGVEAMRDILIDGRTLTSLHTGWGLAWLLIQPVLLLALGALLFNRLERTARARGTLGRY